MSRPRLIFLNRFFAPDQSATSRILSDLAFWLAERGVAVIVVTSRMRYDAPDAHLPPSEVLDGVEVHRVATSRFGRRGIAGRLVDYLTFYVSAAWTLWRLARAGDVIVAKTDPPLIALPAMVIARMRGARLICWLQDIYPEVAARLGVRFVGGPVEKVLAELRDAALRRSCRIVVLGETMADHLRARRAPVDRIAIIPNWTDERTIRPIPAAENPLRRELGLIGRFVIGYSGNLGRAHEPWTMFEAARLLAGDPLFLFVMGGGGHGMALLREAVQRSGLPNIRFLPYQPEDALAAALALPDVHWLSLLPEMEGLIVPSKLYGILAAGRPLIAVTAGDGEIARLCAREGCGVQVDPGDARGFADAVRAFAGDLARTARMGAAARAAAMGTLSREAALGRWKALLEQVGVAFA